MKASTLFAAVAALAVPATAAPLKRDAAPVAAAPGNVDWSNGNPFGEWKENGSFEWTMNWGDRWRTRRPRPHHTPAPQPTPQPQPEQPAPEPEQPEQPAPEPEQPAPEAEKPAPETEQPAPGAEQPAPGAEQPAPEAEQPAPAPVDSSSAEERPADEPTPTPASNPNPATASGGPYTTAVANKVAGEPTLPFANDQTVATQDSTAEDIAGTSAQAKVALDYHNQWRAQFGAAPLTWDSGLAQKAATAMGTCKWEHIGADNLSALWGTGDVVNHFVHNLIDGWADEWRLYDWNNPGFEMATGHFTAMTWKAVTKVGCGWKLGCKDATPGAGMEKKIFFSCVYDPAPNMGGYDDASTRKNYEENVPRYGGN